MKTASLVALAILFAAVIGMVAVAQNVLIRFGDGTNGPTNAPVEMRPTPLTNTPPGWHTNLTDAHVGTNIQDWALADRLWISNQVAVAAAVKNQNAVALRTLFDDFAEAEAGWQNGSNYTAAQLQVLIRKHNGAFLRLRRELQEIYRP